MTIVTSWKFDAIIIVKGFNVCYWL